MDAEHDEGPEDLLGKECLPAQLTKAVVDGLKGFLEAITGVFSETTVQTCIVHLTRFSLACCEWQDRKAVAGELKNIYRAASAEEAQRLLEAFAQSASGQKYPMQVSRGDDWSAGRRCAVRPTPQEIGVRLGGVLAQDAEWRSATPFGLGKTPFGFAHPAHGLFAAPTCTGIA